MTTPEEKLCSRRWRMRHSIWLLWPVLSAGIFTSVGVGLKGAKVRTRTWYLWTAMYGVWTVAVIVANTVIDTGTKQNPVDTPASNALGGITAAFYIGGVIHCYFLNRQWLRWKAAQTDQVAWYASGTNARPVAEPAPHADPAQVLSDLYRGGSSAPHTGAAGPVDVNSADESDFAALGVDQLWVDRIVQTRGRLGGYTSPDQLMTEAGVPPHVFASLRSRITLPDAPQPEPRRGGRQLDF